MDSGFSYEDLFQALAMIGENGTGKSVFLTNLNLYHSRTGCGFGVIDYHGDLIRNIIAGLPPERVSDVILLDLTDAEFPFGLNLCEVEGAKTIESVAATASFIGHLFEVLFGTGLAATPRLLEVLRAVTRTLIEVSPEATLAEVPLLFTDAAVRAKLVSRLTNPAVVLFWEAYNRLTDRQKNDLVESTRNKITAFTDEPLVRHIIGQGKSTVNFGRAMQEGKILLVKLSPLYEEASQLVGGAILAKLLMAGFARASIPEKERRPFMLTVDEVHRVAAASSDLKTFIHEARKFRVGTTLATQTLKSLDEGTAAAFLSCGNIICFRVSGLDAGVLAKNFDATPEPTPQHLVPEPVLRPAADAISHLIHHGHSDARVTRFAQRYLRNFENFMREREPFAWCRWKILDKVVLIYPNDLVVARQQLNEAFSTCMYKQNPDVFIPPLALYILIVSQRHGWEQILDQWVRSKGEYLSGFALRPEGFEEFALGRLAETRAQVRWWRPLRQELAWAEGVWYVLTELRYCLRVLARAPVFDRTGELQLKMQPRTYADQANQRANELTQLPNYTCRARFVSSGEHVLTPKPLPPLLTGEALTARILQIKRRNWEEGYTRFYKDVEKEIRQRVDRLKSPPAEKKRSGRRPGDPPPTSA